MQPREQPRDLKHRLFHQSRKRFANERGATVANSRSKSRQQLTGALAAIGRAGSKPTPPLNLVADFGGGALYLAFGMACAMVEAQRSGKGQVVDAAMTEGAASLMTIFYGLHAAGLHSLERGTNLLDSGSAIYETYECADGRFVSIAPIELKFRKVLFELLGLPYTNDDGAELRGKLESLFKTRTRDEWCSLLEGTDACFAPVLTMAEAPHHPHNVARGTFIDIDGVLQPAPAPRFSRTPSGRPTPPQASGEGSRSALADWGIAEERVDALFACGALGGPGGDDLKAQEILTNRYRCGQASVIGKIS